MKVASLALLTSLVSACGTHKAPCPVVPNIQQLEAGAYAAKYQDLARTHWSKPDFVVTTKISIVTSIANAPPTSIGGCTTYTHEIQLLASWWDGANGVQRQMDVYHELGHCEQYRAHLNTQRDDGTQVSLMAAVEFDWQIYQANQAYYDDELMSVINKCGTDPTLPCPAITP